MNEGTREEPAMQAIERSLLAQFVNDTHVFVPETITASAFTRFDRTIVPALEHLCERGYLQIDERVPNELFSPGGAYAAFVCRLTPTGRATRGLLQSQPARRAAAAGPAPGKRQAS
jgi:hypothetical protein